MVINFFHSPAASRSGTTRERLLANLPTKPASKDYKAYGFDYFDNPDLGIGYGGYRYDGRYAVPARAICAHYGLNPGDRILEVGCAKGFILYEFLKLGMRVVGVDISHYAISNAHPEVRGMLLRGDASSLPFQSKCFSFVFSKEALPHVAEDSLKAAIKECVRVSKGSSFLEIQCGRTSLELAKIRQWDDTHQCIQTPAWWAGVLDACGYNGDVHYKVLFPEGGDE
jgi:SAM-dependent methyltransferase